MLGRTLACFAALLAVGAFATAAGADSRTPGCRGSSTSGVVVRASPHLRLIADGALEFGEYGLYACPRNAKRSIWLVDQDFLPRTPVLAGRFVVYERLRCDRMGERCQGTMHVFDGRAGQTRSARTESHDNGEIEAAAGLLVNARGTAAWIRYTGAPDAGANVWIWPRASKPRVIASGAIELFSLASNGQTLYWTDASGPRSAALR